MWHIAQIVIRICREDVTGLRRRHERQPVAGQLTRPRLHFVYCKQHLMAQVAQLQRERKQAQQVGLPVAQFPAQKLVPPALCD